MGIEWVDEAAAMAMLTHPERLQWQRDITRNVRFELLQLFESPIAEDSQWYVSGI